ncbi:uncharacterized protein PV09_08983 [Verruconis gallopava]|uniref:F-box domain-containing protein n=1 Tax=Verruconis gallopava TaxID=253628 RepID=A0A0D2AK30_9PEZI|nr:uncharacterized protein PV09_08983 [Verruconis gallopava]KIV99323.1 hypothetical protein PV09_08983 [Verruconis gallopava]
MSMPMPHRMRRRSLWRRLVLRYYILRYRSRHALRPLQGRTSSVMEDLPVEIIEAIVGYLSSRDILRFRQTCSKLYSKTNEYCSRHLFHTLVSDLSLDELYYLSTHFINNAQLAAGVRTFRVELKNPAQGLGYDYYWNRRKRGRHLILPCDGFEALHMLFGHYLTNCSAIQIHAKDRQSEIDGPDDQLEPADVLQLILLLAQQVSDFRPKSLELCAPARGEGMRTKGTHLTAERLSMDVITDPQTLSMLAALEDVSLSLVYPDDLVESGWLGAFFGSFQSLQRLELDLDMAWGELESAEALIRRLRCPLLKDLQLHRFKTTLDTLNELLKPCATRLVSLVLGSITLVGSLAQQESWKSWLKSIPDTLPNLNVLDIDLLTASYSEGQRLHLHFADLAGFSIPEENEDQDWDRVGLPKYRTRKYEYVPPGDDSSDFGKEVARTPLVFEVASHGWSRADELVLPGIKYEGTEMRKAVQFMWEHAEEFNMF